MLVLTIVGSLPAIGAPLPAFSLATSLGKGIYLTSLVVLAVGVLAASHAERKAQDERQDERDRLAANRHRELVDLNRHQDANYARLFDSLARGLRESDPEVQAIREGITATHSAIVNIGDIFKIIGNDGL